MSNIFGYAFRGIFGHVSPGWTAALPTQEQLQYMQDVHSLANELRVTPAEASAMIARRKLAYSPASTPLMDMLRKKPGKEKA